MTTRSLRILLEFTWPTARVTRLWDGAGPYVDADGHVWQGASLVSGLDALDQAINGEAYTLALSLTGVAREVADRVWLGFEAGDIIDATVRIRIQPCDAQDQPSGDPETRFSGRVDNMLIDDVVVGDRITSNVTVEATNRFTLRRLTNGAVLSDTDQQARSAVLNPGADPDLFCGRVPLMNDKTIVWPRWN